MSDIPVIDFGFDDGGDESEDGASAYKDFRSVYDMIQCVCFKSQKRQSQDTIRNERRQESFTWPTLPAVSNIRPSKKRKRKRASPPSSVLDLIRETYNSATSKDKESWNVENSGDSNTKTSSVGNNDKTTLSPSEFLQTDIDAKNGYCSFVLQDNSNNAIANFAKRMEEEYILGGRQSAGSISRKHAQLPYSLVINEDKGLNCRTSATGETTRKDYTAKQQKMQLSPHYWIFVGRNTNNGSAASLTGRTEHTDNISHSGTVHIQLKGSKIWKLRPTAELAQRCDEDHDVALRVMKKEVDSNISISCDANDSSKYYYEVLVEEGDFLVINTRLWWHQTLIPPGKDKVDGDDGLSVSIARDLYFEKDHNKTSLPVVRSGQEKDEGQQECMTNEESSWASGFIPMGAILLIDQTIDATNIDGKDDGDISSVYQHLLPSTIKRTTIESQANCQLVLQGNQANNNDDDVDYRNQRGGNSEGNNGIDNKNQKQRELALETIRDIQEGDEFVVLVAVKRSG